MEMATSFPVSQKNRKGLNTTLMSLIFLKEVSLNTSKDGNKKRKTIFESPALHTVLLPKAPISRLDPMLRN